MVFPAWAVSAAVLLDRRDGLHIEDLADTVMETELSGLGRNVRNGKPPKILWTALTKRCPHPEWFSASRRWVKLVKPNPARKNWKVQDAYNAMRAQRRRVMPRLPEEVNATENLVEGAAKSINVCAFERNALARQKCIEFYGTACSACGLEFADRYGELARDFIHVHHLRPLSTIGHNYTIDPVKDLRPICPNCHAVIHLGGKCRTINEIKELLKSSMTK